jgi:hypothetical protein
MSIPQEPRDPNILPSRRPAGGATRLLGSPELARARPGLRIHRYTVPVPPPRLQRVPPVNSSAPPRASTSCPIMLQPPH